MSIERIYLKEPTLNSEVDDGVLRAIVSDRKTPNIRRRVLPVGRHIITPPGLDGSLCAFVAQVRVEGNAEATVHKLSKIGESPSDDNVEFMYAIPQDGTLFRMVFTIENRELLFGALSFIPLESPVEKFERK